MGIEPIGVLTVLIGIACLYLGSSATIIAFSIFPVLGGAAAVIFGATGIQPGHLFLAFLAISVLSQKEKLRTAIELFRPPSPVFWLALLVTYGIVAGFFAPRLMANLTEIVPIGNAGELYSDGTVHLGPVSGNITQAIYLIADLATFMLIISIASSNDGFRSVTIGLVGFAAANVTFGILDMISPGTPLVSLLSYIRNAGYTFHEDEIVDGMRRIIGSWPEASAFAGISLGAIGFTGTLWLCGRYSAISGCLCILSILLTVRSTSSGGIAGLPICMVILYATGFFRAGGLSGTRASAAVVVLAPVLFVFCVFWLLFDTQLYKQIYDYLDIVLLSKPTSQSAIERGAWNSHGMSNFIDSYGLGVGLGTSRASSLALALLSNVGIPGATFFILFLTTSLFLRKGTPRSEQNDIGIAARNGCLCLIVGNLISGTTVDLGLYFFTMAGLAASAHRMQYHELKAAVSET